MADDKLVVTDELIGTVAAKVSEIIDKKTTKPSQKVPEFADAKMQEKYENTYRLWMNNGYENPHDQFDPAKKDQRIGFKEMCDALSTPDASILIGHVISNVVKEAMEPLLVGASLLHTIRFSAGQQITFPAAGAFTAEDIAEGAEYPERKLEVAGTVTAFIGKSGVKVRITEEMLRYSQYVSAAHISDVMVKHGAQSGKP